MEVRIDKKHELELVSFCGLSYGKFMQFTEFISLARQRERGWIEEIAKELHISCHWALDWSGKTISLLDLTWEQIFMLNSILVLDDKRNCFLWIHKAIEKAVDMALSARPAVKRGVNNEK